MTSVVRNCDCTLLFVAAPANVEVACCSQVHLVAPGATPVCIKLRRWLPYHIGAHKTHVSSVCCLCFEATTCPIMGCG